MTGLFVAFEGGEGAGKSTQIELAAQWLRSRGHVVVTTREPGGTALGAELRRLVLDPDGDVTPRAETLLYAADRAHHVETLIAPALDRGEVVLTDRYVDSTLAYQGVGRALGDGARTVTTWATGGLTPQLTVLLDLDPVVGLTRASPSIAPRSVGGGGPVVPPGRPGRVPRACRCRAGSVSRARCDPCARCPGRRRPRRAGCAAALSGAIAGL